MGLLREFFTPRSKTDGIKIMAICLGVILFIGFEGYAFVQILQNPYGLDEWHAAERVDGANYITLSNSELYNTPHDLDGYTIFVIRLQHLEGLNVTILLNASNCIIEKMAQASVEEALHENAVRLFPDELHLINVTNNITMDLRDMNYPKDFDIILVMARNMAFGPGAVECIKLFIKVSLND